MSGGIDDIHWYADEVRQALTSMVGVLNSAVPFGREAQRSLTKMDPASISPSLSAMSANVHGALNDTVRTVERLRGVVEELTTWEGRLRE